VPAPVKQVWQITCLHPKCRVLTYVWSKPGDTCPGCNWGSGGSVAIDKPPHKEFVEPA
jgi:hypothetical protein